MAAQRNRAVAPVPVTVLLLLILHAAAGATASQDQVAPAAPHRVIVRLTETPAAVSVSDGCSAILTTLTTLPDFIAILQC